MFVRLLQRGFRGFQFAVGLGKARQQFLDLLFVLADLPIEPRQIVFQSPQLALLRDGRRFAAKCADRQCSVGFEQFPLQRHETAAAPGAGRQVEGDVERIDHPGIAQQLLGKFGGPFRRTQHRIGPALHAGVRQQIGQRCRIEIERFEKSARGPVNSVRALVPCPASRRTTKPTRPAIGTVAWLR